MDKKLKMKLIVLLALLITNALFAGQKEMKTEKSQEILVKVTKEDKMYSPFYRTRFSTTGIKFKYFNFGWGDIKNAIKENNILNKIINASNLSVKKYFKLFVKESNKGAFSISASKFKMYLMTTMHNFNTWLAKSQANRDKISVILTEYERKKIEKKKEEERALKKHLGDKPLMF